MACMQFMGRNSQQLVLVSTVLISFYSVNFYHEMEDTDLVLFVVKCHSVTSYLSPAEIKAILGFVANTILS